MTADVPAESKPTREECIAAAGAIYGSILADPDRRAEILAHRAELKSQQHKQSA